ncbi:NitT/TauT family transport system ATP-binding protein [Hathewaya proteolytica DSM 3090]|uniref:NitT/TauT family transport system ATP-binding protein n=1 Tax=Hathewaya proteolytica DSM 3090 TaxID=1121331 RepID=A0A1M6QY18_9CLOT|nr:ATP-binding cassette domain-containing protein [Hathewaya proteolytica]SHK25104.1 NitT/TauT family transport system ATP-binding protein [Hathewaya proteolytica DSM 3090]
MRCESIITVQKLRKSYDKILFKELSFSIEEGEVVAVMGPSGVGKTTFLNILMGLDKDYEGTIEGLFDKEFSAVFQEDRLLEEFSVMTNIKIVVDKKQGKRISREEIEKACETILPKGICHNICKTLSGGMKRRVEIIKAMMAESDVICMDEPFKGLDRRTKEKVVQYVLQNKGKRTMFIVTHDKEDIELINPGRIINIESI